MSRHINPEITLMGREKRIKNADEFARKTYELIENMKEQEQISSFRDTMKMLNEKKIPSYQGGKWHVKTIQNLYNRCKKLGIFN